MSNRLAAFLIDLGESPKRLEEYRRDPRSVLRRALTSDDEPFYPVWVQQSAMVNVVQAP